MLELVIRSADHNSSTLIVSKEIQIILRKSPRQKCNKKIFKNKIVKIMGKWMWSFKSCLNILLELVIQSADHKSSMVIVFFLNILIIFRKSLRQKHDKKIFAGEM